MHLTTDSIQILEDDALLVLCDMGGVRGRGNPSCEKLEGGEILVVIHKI